VGFVKRKITVKVYIGLVPISPKTRPRDFIKPFTGDSLLSTTPPLRAKGEK
jgi:hypothetical protein